MSMDFLQYHCQNRNSNGKITTMDQIQLFEEAKKKLGARSWYHFAQLTEMNEAEISEFRRGKRVPDVYACFKLAEILGKSQAEILAAIHATSEKNETKRLYFKRFFSTAELWIILALALPNFTGFSGTAQAAGNHAETRANTSFTESPIIRNIRNLIRRAKRRLLKNERYFTCNWHVKFFGAVC